MFYPWPLWFIILFRWLCKHVGTDLGRTKAFRYDYEVINEVMQDFRFHGRIDTPIRGFVYGLVADEMVKHGTAFLGLAAFGLTDSVRVVAATDIPKGVPVRITPDGKVEALSTPSKEPENDPSI